MNAWPRLDESCVAQLPAAVVRPGYARSTHATGIVHLGIGAFHRAHQAEYTDDAMAAAGGDWRILGVSLKSPAVREQLRPQQGLYCIVSRAPEAESIRLIGSISDVVSLGDEAPRVLAALTDRRTRIVSLTVTEKGYCHDPASRQLNLAHPDIVRDLAAVSAPRSAVGLIVEALRRRRQASIAPFTVLSCDNLPANGAVLRSLAVQFAAVRDAELAGWIEGNVAFPATMVDRIVPATTDADRFELARTLGVWDAGAVKTEPFRQWVIEDLFSDGRPAWEQVGAWLVSDVAPFEAAKLRMLNGSHSTLAYLGHLSGAVYVHDAMANAAITRLIEELMVNEAAPTLSMPAGFDVEAYGRELRQRFRNPALQHRCQQIAMDGSQKLPQRLLETLRANLAAGRSIRIAALGVAAWMRYVEGRDEHGNLYEVSDPLAPRLAAIHLKSGRRPAELVSALLQVSDVFGADLPQSTALHAQLTAHLASLYERGTAATVAQLAGEAGSSKGAHD